MTIQDFWRRWHISLSTWLRDYLYISLGGNRKGDVRTYANLFLTMAIGGLWHGASWSFLLWGVIHGAALAVARLWNQRGLWWPAVLSYPLTLLTVLFAWTPFRATSWDGTVAMLSGPDRPQRLRHQRSDGARSAAARSSCGWRSPRRWCLGRR